MHLNVAFGRYAFEPHGRHVFQFKARVLFVIDVRAVLRHRAVEYAVDEIEYAERTSEIAVEKYVRAFLCAF